MLSYCSVQFDFLWFSTENVCHKLDMLFKTADEILLFISTCILFDLFWGKTQKVNTSVKFLSDNLKIEQQYLTFILDFL